MARWTENRTTLRALQGSWLAGSGVWRARDSAPAGMSRGYEGKPPKLCQWIAGEPTAADSCKCGAPIEPGKPYCAPHWARAWRPSTVREP